MRGGRFEWREEAAISDCPQHVGDCTHPGRHLSQVSPPQGQGPGGFNRRSASCGPSENGLIPDLHLRELRFPLITRCGDQVRKPAKSPLLIPLTKGFIFVFRSSLIDLHKMAANVHADEMNSYNAWTVTVLCSKKCLKRCIKANAGTWVGHNTSNTSNRLRRLQQITLINPQR